jgi:hypothetical protein
LEDELIESKVSEEEIEYCMFTSQNFAMLASLVDVEVIERYINQITPQMDGTLDAILPHFMSIQDIRKGQHNSKFIVSVLRKILEIKKLTEEFHQS